MLTCPHCAEPLAQVGNALRCSQGHSYDIAKEGYVNLLLANQKASGSPGDTKEMASSRRAFLNGGYYELLSDRIVSLVGNETACRRLLDIGCGEGYYLNRLKDSFHVGVDGYGLDISKEAIKLAARHKDLCFLVASVHQSLPFTSASLDVVLNVFAPRNPAEFARVLHPGGMAVVVVPAGGHLAALHDALGMPYIDGDKARRATEDFEGALVPSHGETIRYRRVLPPEDVLHLIQMTPTFWHLSDAARAGMKSLPSLDIEFAFTLIVMRHEHGVATRNE